MSIDAKYAKIVANVRAKLGDYAYVDGTNTLDESKCIWTDEEHLSNLHGACRVTFRDKYSLDEVIDTYKEELVAKRAQYEFLIVLATDAARRMRFNLLDVSNTKVSPSEFKVIADAVMKTLTIDISEGEESGIIESGATVVVGSVRRVSRLNNGRSSPDRFHVPAKIPPTKISRLENGNAKIEVEYSYISNFKCITIKRKSPGETILYDSQIMRELEIIDTVPTISDATLIYQVIITSDKDELTTKEFVVT